MSIIWLVIVGAAAGFIATRLMKLETDVIMTVVIGIAGALIGGVVLRFLITFMGAASGFIGALLGSLLLIWLWKTYLRK